MAPALSDRALERGAGRWKRPFVDFLNVVLDDGLDHLEVRLDLGQGPGGHGPDVGIDATLGFGLERRDRLHVRDELRLCVASIEFLTRESGEALGTELRP